MKCKNCGQKLNKGDVFCGNCGAPVPSAPSSRKTIYIVIAIVIAVIAIAGIILGVIFLSDSSDDELTKRIQSAAGESRDTGSDQSDSDETDVTPDSENSSDTEDYESESPFVINSDSHADYTAALDPSEYVSYTSEIPEFNFWYPTNFYNHVVYDTESHTTTLGTSEEEITFTADDGSQLRFQAIRRTDNLDLDEMTNSVYTTEMGLLTSSEKIINTVRDIAGKVIVTGWDKSYPDNTVYSLTKIRSDYILQMKVIFPSYTDSNDEHQKGYLTECYYRMCGFSDADPWRTYDEYLDEVY